MAVNRCRASMDVNRCRVVPVPRCIDGRGSTGITLVLRCTDARAVVPMPRCIDGRGHDGIYDDERRWWLYLH